MRLLFAIVITAAAVVAIIADISHAQAGTDECYSLSEHGSPGNYLLYASTANPDIPWRAKAGSGVHSVSYRRLPPNSSFEHSGYTYTNDHTSAIYRVTYTVTEPGGILLICCKEIGYWAPTRTGPPGAQRPSTGSTPPSGSTAPPANPAPPPANVAPTVTGRSSIEYAENGTGTVETYTATDPENGEIAWSLSGDDSADFSITRGALTFNASPDYENPADADRNNVYRVTAQASDGANTVTLDLAVTVTDVNEPPRFPGPSATRSVDDTAPGVRVGVPVEATDPEGDALTYTLGGTSAASFTISSSTGQLLTAVALDSDSYSLTVSVSDGKDSDGNADTSVDDTIDVSITVTGIALPEPEPEPPSTNPPGGGGSGGGGSHSGGGSSSSGGSQSASGQGRAISLSPQIFGLAQVDYPENGVDPVAEYTAEDPEGDDVVWSLYGADRKSFQITESGVLSFRSPPDYEQPAGLRGNTYWVVVQAENARRPSRYDVQNVYVTVTDVNELGEIRGDSELSLEENRSGQVVRYQVDDPEKGVITWSLSGPDSSVFEIDGDGGLIATAGFDYESPGSVAGSNVHTLTVTATDNGQPALSAKLDVTLTVIDVNEAPTSTEIPAVELATEHPPRTLDLGVYFTDPDGDVLTYVVSAEVAPGVAIVALEGGALSITPTGPGTVSFDVVASDPGGLSASGAVRMSVTEPEPVSTPVPPKATEPAPAATPAPVAVDDTPVQTTDTAPPPSGIAAMPEPSPTHVPLPLMSERRLRNLEQQPAPVSEMVVTFTIEPHDASAEEVPLPPMATPLPSKSLTGTDALPSDSDQMPASSVTMDDAGGFPLWLIVMLIVLVVLTAGYSVRMFVTHRLT